MLDFPNNPSNGQVFQGLTWDGVKWTNVGAVSQASAFNDVGRNLLHNGLMNVQQRGVGGWTGTTYTVDRWQTVVVGSTGTTNLQALADADRAVIGDEQATIALQAVFTGTAGATDAVLFLQKVENVRRLANKTVTVSFWSNAGAALRLGVSLDQNFGSGGSPSAAVLGNGVAVTLSGTWTRYTVSLVVPSIAGKTIGTNHDDNLELNLWFTAGSSFNARSGNVGVQSGAVNIWGVQLEIGTVATPLEKIDAQQDLAKCQRFYSIGSVRLLGGAYIANIVQAQWQSFPVQMRATPTITPTWTTQSNCTGTIAPVDGSGFEPYSQSAAAGQTNLQGSYTASADL
jgi:hypothetical protein